MNNAGGDDSHRTDVPTKGSSMTSRRPVAFLGAAAVVPLAALAAAGCGGSSGGSQATAATSHPVAKTAATARSTSVRVANSRLGRIVVDSRGHTLYLFKKDSGTKSACTGACATAWPPLRAKGKPVVRGGAHAALVGTAKRSDGTSQVTYHGHPLYGFVMDKKAGDTKGEGLTAFGGRWFAVSASGNQVAAKAAAAKPAPKPAPRPAAPKPAAKPPSNGIPQNNGGDGDADNNGGPSDGDGNI
jgi:predicted lipoprotein with Yx(FWY)xxD motif